MPVYMIIDIRVHDRRLYEEYTMKAEPVVKSHGGKYIARTDRVVPVSQNWTPERIVIIQFPSEEKMKECFASDEYKKIAHLRTGSTESRTILVEGYEGPSPKDFT